MARRAALTKHYMYVTHTHGYSNQALCYTHRVILTKHYVTHTQGYSNQALCYTHRVILTKHYVTHTGLF